MFRKKSDSAARSSQNKQCALCDFTMGLSPEQDRKIVNNGSLFLQNNDLKK